MPKTPLVNQPDATPTRKSQADLIAGAVATLACYGVYLWTGIQPPIGVEGALASIFGFIAAYFVKDRMNA